MIAFLGGTFDPIHFGHLEAAKKINELKFFTEVSLMPSYHPVQKNSCMFNLNERVELIKEALKLYPELTINYTELNLKKPSFTVDTLKLIRKDNNSQRICLIFGSDILKGFNTWKECENLHKYCHIFVIPRPGFKIEKKDIINFKKANDLNDLNNKQFGLIFYSDIQILDISSTLIKEKLLNNEKISNLTPRNVIQKIIRFNSQKRNLS